jgi:hypothetical protein
MGFFFFRVFHRQASCIKFRNFKPKFFVLKWSIYSLVICCPTLAKSWLVFVILPRKSLTNYGKVRLSIWYIARCREAVQLNSKWWSIIATLDVLTRPLYGEQLRTDRAIYGINNGSFWSGLV